MRWYLVILLTVVLVGCGGGGTRQAPAAPVSAPAAAEATPVEKGPDPEAMHAAGMTALSDGRYADAATALGTTATVRGTADDWNDYGFALGKLERWAESAEACRHAVKLTPKHAYALYNLGWAEYKLGQYLPARTHIGNSDALQGRERWETRYALGLISEALGEKSRAAVDYEAAAARAMGKSEEPARALERLRDYLPLPLPAPAGWTAYTNVRFGFRIFYPDAWKPGRPPDNGDGLHFVSPDGKSQISAWGGFQLRELPRWQPGPQDKPLLYGWVETAPPKTPPGIRSIELHAYRTDEEREISYGVLITAPEDQWTQLQPVIDTVFRSFKITPGNAYAGY